jgi:transcriptional regulator with XRE-family HTH domain
MSKLSELLKAADERHHMTLRDRQTKAGSGIQFGTIGKYLRGIHPDHPDEETLEALSRAFDLPLAKVQEAAGVPVGAGHWEPPPEVTRLSKRQQKALTELIRSMAEESSDGRQPDAEKSDDDEGRGSVASLTGRRHPRLQQRAARHGKLDIPDEQRRQDQAGEESQDPGWPDEDQDSEDWDD